MYSLFALCDNTDQHLPHFQCDFLPVTEQSPAGSWQLSRGAGRLIPCNPDVCQHELESSRQEKTELWKLYPALLKALLSEYQLALT